MKKKSAGQKWCNILPKILASEENAIIIIIIIINIVINIQVVEWRNRTVFSRENNSTSTGFVTFA